MTPLRLLFLGGTGYVGPYYIREAVRRGHQVSIFNRGSRARDFPDGVRQLVGDREGALHAIQGDWDAVIDLATFRPAWVRSIGQQLAGRVGRYVFISLAVYDFAAQPDDLVPEDGAVVEYTGDSDPYSVTQISSRDDYAALKVMCEREAERHFPGRTLILRSGYIAGPDDPNSALIYWPLRMAKGGHMIAAGHPSSPVQLIDIRDLAEWSIRMIEDGAAGTFNTVGPGDPMTLGQLLGIAGELGSGACEIDWVDADWLGRRDDRYVWGRPLFWTGGLGGWGDTMRMDATRAVAHGLKTRPVAATLTDALEWYRRQPAPRRDQLLRVKAQDMRPAYNMSWKELLDQERVVRTAWQATKP